MEMIELQYFFAVAKTQNIHRASENIGVSASSLSKAISRLEEELQVKLFKREGRHIFLTAEGKFLKQRANEILSLETQTRIDILGQETQFKATIGASEILLSHFGAKLAKQISKLYPFSKIELISLTENKLFSKIVDGEIDLGITTYVPPKHLYSKKISDVKFQTVVGKKHTLYKKKLIPIEEVMKHPFVTTKKEIFGHTNQLQSFDGWRDDKFPRKASYITNSLKTLEQLVQAGMAMAYLPNYLLKEQNYKILNIDGCSFECSQKIMLVVKDKHKNGWINQLL